MPKMFMSVLLFSLVAVAQQPVPQVPPAKQADVTELEKVKFQSALKDLVILQGQYRSIQDQIALANTQLSNLQKEYKDKDAVIDALCADIKKAHNYGDDVVCNKSTGNIEVVEKPKAEAPKAATPKPEVKK